MICEKDFLAARLVKSDKNVHTPCKVSGKIRGKIVCGCCGAKLNRAVKNRKTARWECENPDCGHMAHISDESLVAAINALLDELAHTPEALAKRIPQEPVPGGNAQRIANELTNALNRGAESVEYLRTLVFACAAERYNELPDSSFQYKVDRLRQRLEGGETDEALRKELLETAVRCIRVTDEDGIALEPVNGQMIATEVAEP